VGFFQLHLLLNVNSMTDCAPVSTSDFDISKKLICGENDLFASLTNDNDCVKL
jgi:hypothetical protein